MQLLLGYDDDLGSFTLEPSNVKAVIGRKKILSPVEMGPKIGGFWGKMGVETLDFCFATHKRHFLARKRVV